MLPETDEDGVVDYSSVTKIKLLKDTTHVLRLFHKPVVMFRTTRFGGVNGRDHYNFDAGARDIIKKYNQPPNEGLFVETCGINVLDRGNPGQVFLLEAGLEIFIPIKNFWQNNQVDPGGNSGPDFVIKISEGSNNNILRFEVGYKMGPKPFSAEEKSLLKDNRIDLPLYYRDIIPIEDTEAVIRSLLQRGVVCPDCKGSKKIQLLLSSRPCTNCDENGMVQLAKVNTESLPKSSGNFADWSSF